MTNFKARSRRVCVRIASIVLVIATLIVVWVYLIKPWPGVESSNDWKLVDPPASGVYQAGEVLSWQKPRVCAPEGETTVQFLARRAYPPGAYDFVMYTRILRYPVESCNSPNITRIVVPHDLSSGQYDIRIRACTDTPNPRDTCIEVEGPTFRMVNPAFGTTDD